MSTRRNALLAALLVAAATPTQAQVSLPAPVEQTMLAQDAFSLGTLTPGLGALDPSLWKGADPARLSYLLSLAPDSPAAPSLGEAMRRVLLSQGTAPEGAPTSLGGRKLVALARAGFTEEARSIASLASASRGEPLVAQALAIADLLEGKTADACRRNAALREDRDASFWMKLRVVCYAAAGERDAADLTLTLLREQNALHGPDEALLMAAATGVKPAGAPAPENALHLAVFRLLGLQLAPAQLRAANSGVLVAIARDLGQNAPARIAAGAAAASMGVLASGEIAAIFESIDLDVADLGRAADAARTAPDDPLTDVLLYQSVRQMTAPEFLRDKAARISTAIGVARSFPRLVAVSQVYAEDITALEGALLAPRDAGRFALAALVAGDAAGAAGWLSAMRGTTGLSELSDEDGGQFIDLVNLLAILDRGMASSIAQQNGVALASGIAGAPSPATDGAAETRRARIVEGAFDAAIASIEGQAALAALAMSAHAPLSDPIAAAVVNQSLRAARLNDLRRRVDLETALMLRTAASLASAPAASGPPTPTPVGVSPVPAMPTPEAGKTPTPRIKPRSGT